MYLYTFSILVLFINFYFKAYIKSPSQKSVKDDGVIKNGSAQNGKVATSAQNGDVFASVKNGEVSAKGDFKKIN